MELWIRSQDKKCLTMVNHLYVDDNHHIRQQDDLILGTYETKRALEILDEIENFKDALTIINLSDKKNDLIIATVEKLNSFTYKMPKE